MAADKPIPSSISRARCFIFGVKSSMILLDKKISSLSLDRPGTMSGCCRFGAIKRPGSGHTFYTLSETGCFSYSIKVLKIGYYSNGVSSHI